MDVLVDNIMMIVMMNIISGAKEPRIMSPAQIYPERARDIGTKSVRVFDHISK